MVSVAEPGQWAGADADAAVGELLDAPRERRIAIGRRGREHVLALFGLDRMAEEYEALFERALAERRESAAD